MIYLAHGLTLALAWFVLIDAALSIAAYLSAPSVMRAVASRRAAARARVLLSFRLAPALLALAFVAALFVPSYWWLEPRGSSIEEFDGVLAVLAALGAVVVGAGAWRGAAGWQQASTIVGRLSGSARLARLTGVPVPAYIIASPQPAMLMAGVVRPRLLVTRGLLDALSPEEIAVGAAHELEHLKARDNLKRLTIRCTPDFWGWTRRARAVERAWCSAVEHAADAAASADDWGRALTLASALLKVARLMPSTGSIVTASALVSGREVASRVQQLVGGQAHVRPARIPARLAWTAACATVVTLAVAYSPLLATVHRVSELLVRQLP